MYMCLWKEVADDADSETEGTQLVRWVQRNKAALSRQAARFRAAYGLNPHPYILVRETKNSLSEDGSRPLKKLKSFQ